MAHYLVVAYERVVTIGIYGTLEEAVAESNTASGLVRIYPVGDDDMAQSIRQEIAEQEAAESGLDSPGEPPETI